MSNRFEVHCLHSGEVTLGNLFAVGVRKSFQTFGCYWHRVSQVGLLHSGCMSKEGSLQVSTCALATGDFLERKPYQVYWSSAAGLPCRLAGNHLNPTGHNGLEEGSNLSLLQTARSPIYLQTTLRAPGVSI